MKKNTYLTILTIVTVLCIIAGSIMHLGLFSFHLPFSDVSIGKGSAGAMQKDSQTVDAFSAIEIDANVLAVTVECGDSYQVAMNCNEKLMPTVEVKGDTLVIKQKVNTKLFTGSTHAEMTVTLPAGTELNSLTTVQNVGDFELDSVDVKKADITVNVGDVELENVKGSNLKVDSDTGDVEVKDCQFETVDIDSDIGDADYSSTVSLEDYTMDLKTDVGSVDIHGVHGSDHDSDHMGSNHSYTQKGSAGSLTIKVDVGSISVK